MRFAPTYAAVGLAVLLTLSGCATPSGDRRGSGERAESSADTTASGRETLSPADVAANEAEAAQAMARRPAEAGMSSAELLALLNETSRELGTLRANNAKLRAERSRFTTPRVETIVKPEANDERLTASVRSFGQFKQELAGFLDEAEKFRVENAALGKQVVALTEQVREAQAQVEPLKAEATSQREAREQADAAVEKLREQLRAIAKALSAAGLSLDAFSGEKDPTARLETSAARIRAAAEEERRR
jgi:regulator of replication initiation timing